MKRSPCLWANKPDHLREKFNQFYGTVGALFSIGAILLVIVLPAVLAQSVQSKQQQGRQRFNGSVSATPSGPCPAWQSIADMPQDVEAATATSDGTYAYVVGGYSFNDGDVNSFRRYDPATNTWTSLAPMPVAASMASAVYYPPTHKIYVFGGEHFSTGVLYEVTRIYDITSNSWSAGAFMPDVRSFMASGYNSADGKIYLVSGYNTDEVSSAQGDTWEYDPVTNTFTARAPFPHPVGGAASGIINGHMYVAGGRDATNTVVNLLWDYDIAANTWTQKASMSCGQQNVPGSAVAFGKLWVFGGGNPFAFNKSVSNIPPLRTSNRPERPTAPSTSNSGRAYDPATDSWLLARDMNTARSLPAGTAIGNKLFAAGGFDESFGTLSSAEIVDACTEGTPPEIPNYTVTTSSGASIVPGTTDIGIHCHDCTTPINLPFPVQFYDQIFTTANVADGGTLQFTSADDGCCGGCLPAEFLSNVIAANWSHLYIVDAANGQGIFTSISGTAPNRIFNIEWRARHCCSGGAPTENFEVRLYESQNRFDVIYGTVSPGSSSDFGIGVQRDNGLCNYTTVSCGTPPAAGTKYIFAATPQIAAATSTIQAEGCTPVNGAVDPDETVTVSFCVQNFGGQSTSNLIGTLQATGGVTNPSAPQAYGALAAGQTACRSFTFTADGTCGGVLNATIHLQDGATDLGDVTYTFTLGPSATPLNEGFNDIAILPGAGWFLQNNSQPLGTTGWFQGDTSLFAAQSGSANSYIAADYRNGSGTAIISNWLLTPPLTLHNGDQLIFFTRTVTNPSYPDRLQVRMSTNGSSANVGVSATDVGDFTSLLLDINPTYTTTDYPTSWTQFTATVTGVPSPTMGRLAFRYFAENAGPGGANADYIGIDTVSYHIAPTCATDCAPLVLSALSRKGHGGAGNFDVDLPPTGTPGIECRSGGETSDYTIVVTFPSDVIVSGSPQAQVTLGSATIGTGGVSNGGVVTVSGDTVTIPLTNVANAQTINVRLNDVTNASGTDAVAADVTIAMSRLLGDTNGNGAVNSADAAQTKAGIGQALTSSNFRSDVNVNGTINSADVAIVKSAIGSGLP